jgi:hypothetical protein
MIRFEVRVPPTLTENLLGRAGSAIKRVKPHRASIGIHDEDGRYAKTGYTGIPSDQDLAAVMREHEFGTSQLPRRSFLRDWFDDHLNELVTGMGAAMRAEFGGDPLAIPAWVKEVHAKWKSWIETSTELAQLSPGTVAAKQKAGLSNPDQPLIATRQFIEAWRAKLDKAFL